MDVSPWSPFHGTYEDGVGVGDTSLRTAIERRDVIALREATQHRMQASDYSALSDPLGAVALHTYYELLLRPPEERTYSGYPSVERGVHYRDVFNSRIGHRMQSRNTPNISGMTREAVNRRHREAVQNVETAEYRSRDMIEREWRVELRPLLVAEGAEMRRLRNMLDNFHRVRIERSEHLHRAAIEELRDAFCREQATAFLAQLANHLHRWQNECLVAERVARFAVIDEEQHHRSVLVHSTRPQEVMIDMERGRHIALEFARIRNLEQKLSLLTSTHNDHRLQRTAAPHCTTQ